MKYFLDSAKIDEIDLAFRSFGIDGITTNPNHVMNSGRSHEEIMQDMAVWAGRKELSPDEFPISIEVNPHILEEKKMLAEAEKIAKLSDFFVIKLPCTVDGISAVRKLEEKGIRCNVTLIFSPSQALAAARAGATFISPFVGWKEVSGEDCNEYLTAIREILDNYERLHNTEVITAALRTGKQIAEAARIGMDIVTCGLDVYTASFYHPFTDYGLKKFQHAWDNTKQNGEGL